MLDTVYLKAIPVARLVYIIIDITLLSMIWST